MLILLATIVGALFPTFLLSRLLWWLLKRWRAAYWRVLVANGASLLMSLALVCFVGGMPADEALLIYVPAQSLWLVIDLLWLAPKGRTVDPSLPQAASAPRRPMGKPSRIGILVTVLGILLAVFGVLTGGWNYGSTEMSRGASTLGLLMTTCGYAVSRLWFWATR